MIREHSGRGWAVDTCMFWKHAKTVNINQYTMYSLNNVPCTLVLGPGLSKQKCATVGKIKYSVNCCYQEKLCMATGWLSYHPCLFIE